MAMRSLIFNIRGITEFRPTPPSLKERVGECYQWYRVIRLLVRLPKEKQNSKFYPEFTKRLLSELPELSIKNGGLPCGLAGDFTENLKKGTSMGHVWEHVYAFCFDMTSSSLGYGQHVFRWQTKVVESKEEYTIYRLRMFHESEPPAEFFGLESLVCGYLNALIEGEDFPLKRRLRSFIEYRKERMNHGTPKFFRNKVTVNILPNLRLATIKHKY